MPVKKRAATGNDRFVAMMKALHQVKIDNRLVVELFLEIPDANMYPDYPKIVDHPISLAEIGKRVKLGSYANEDALLADLELMAENARKFNGDESPVVDDAVDILDFALLYFNREPSAMSRRQLQLQVLLDLENYKSKGRRLSDAFILEPDAETYPNYRDVVKHPSSFTTVREHIEKKGPYANWTEAADQIGLMFRNAMLYNLEGSTIYSDAKTLLKQLDAKINKYSAIPHHLQVALPKSANGASSGSSRHGTVEDEDEDMDDMDDGDSDMDDDEDERDSDIDSQRPLRDTARYDDDDDDDFEADSEDVDEEDIVNENEGGNDGQDPNMVPMGLDMVPIGVDPSNMPPPFMQPSHVYDEVVYRPPDEGVEHALLRLVTCESTPIPPHMAAIEDVKRSANDVLQLRFPPSSTKAFTTYATTLPYYQSTLRVTVFPNLNIQPLQTHLLLNGAKLMPVGPQDPTGSMTGLASGADHEEYEMSLAPGLNQITIIAIKASHGGYIRPYGPPPLAEAESDEERMVLFINLSK